MRSDIGRDNRAVKRRGAVWVVLATVVGVGPACRGGGAANLSFPGAPVVIISIDTLRADHLPAYGYGKVDTPSIDRLRRDSVLFRNAYTHVPLTLPAHVSLLSGLLPFEHGVRDNLGYHLDTKTHATMAALLRARGYATGAAVSAYVLRGGTGIGQGFDFYEDNIVAPNGSDALGRVQRAGRETLALAKPWLDGVKDRPFFLFFHVYEPHAPYDPPEPYKSRYALAYDGEIATADEVVGGLLEELRRTRVYDRAVVALLSDHGEGLGEHGEEDHGILLYRWALQVPLLLKLPGSARGGTSIDAPVGLIDVLPTLAALLGIAPPKGLPGRSLLEADGPSRRLYAETFYPRIHLGWHELRSLVDERWQYVEGRKRELYEFSRDPGELSDLLSAEGTVARSMQKDLAGFPAELVAPSGATAEQQEKLAALGYLGGALEPTGPLPDARESIHVLTEVKAAFRLGAAGRDAEAVLAFRKILSQYPNLLDARYELGQTLVRLGRWQEAYEAYREAMRTSASLTGPISIALSRVCMNLGRMEEAEANARLGLATNAPHAHAQLARIALARGDLAAAEREALAAKGDLDVELGAAVVRGDIRIRDGRIPEALALLETAKKTVRDRGLAAVPDLDLLRGDALARLGRYAEAEGAFKEEIRSFPGNSNAYARLAIVYGIQHRTLGEVDRLLDAMFKANPTSDTVDLAATTLDSMGDRQGSEKWKKRRAHPIQ